MIDVEKLKKKLVKSIEIMKLISSVPRLRIMLMLLIFRKVSLSQLSNLLGRTKAAVTHHLKKFETLGIIKISREEARGSIDSKFYELDLTFFKLVNLSFDNFQSLEEDESKEILHYILLRDKWMFEVFRNIFMFSNQFYKEIDDRYMNGDSNLIKQTQDFYFKSPVDYNLWFLSDNGRKSYEKEIIQFKERINEIVKEDSESEASIEKPYCVFNVFLPLKKLTEFDNEKKRIIDFLG